MSSVFSSQDQFCPFWDQFCGFAYIIRLGDHFCLGITFAAVQDSFGKPTYFSGEGSCSATDYSIISENFFHQVPSFIVKPQSLLSDHCQIVSWLKTLIDLELKCKQFDDIKLGKITAQIPLEFSVKLNV